MLASTCLSLLCCLCVFPVVSCLVEDCSKDDCSVHLLQNGMRLQTARNSMQMQESDRTPEYAWPTGRGPIHHLGASTEHGIFNLSKPSWIWHDPQGEWSSIPTGVAIDNERNIYLSLADGIRKFTRDGEQLWSYERPASSRDEAMNNAFSLWNGAVHGISTKGRAFAVDMEDGMERWSTKFSEGCSGNYGQVVAHDGVMIVAGNVKNVGSAGMADTTLFGLNATTGNVMWTFEPEVPVWNFAASFADDGTFVFQDLEGRAHRNRVDDGKLLWKAGGVPGTWTDGQALLGSNRIVYSVSVLPFQKKEAPGIVFARKLDDGSLLWNQSVPTPPNNQPSVGRLAGKSGLSLVQPIGQQVKQGERVDVHVFDATTGERQWVFEGPTQQGPMVAGDVEGIPARLVKGIQPITAPNPWGPATIDGDGNVLLGSETGHFFALRDLDKDGKISGDQEVSVFNTGAAFVGSSAPALARGTLAFASINQLFVYNFD